MTDKLTIDEAVKITGKSKSTIYRHLTKQVTMIDRSTLEEIMNTKRGRKRIFAICECGRVAFVKGMCMKCYKQNQRSLK